MNITTSASDGFLSLVSQFCTYILDVIFNNFPLSIVPFIAAIFIVRGLKGFKKKETQKIEGEVRYSKSMIDALGDTVEPDELNPKKLRSQSGKHLFMNQVILDFDNKVLIFVDKDGKEKLNINELIVVKQHYQFEYSELNFVFKEKSKYVITTYAVDAELILHHLSTYLGKNIVDKDRF